MVGLWGCGQVQPVRRAVPPLLVLEQRLPPEPPPVRSDTAAVQEPDTAVAGMPTRRLPTLREAMEQIAGEQTALRETLEEVHRDIQRMGLLLAELTELARTSELSVAPPAAKSPSRKAARHRHPTARRRTAGPGSSVQEPRDTAAAALQRSSPKPSSVPAELMQRYARALQHLARREYAEAWALLEGVLQDAKDPMLVSNVRYWRGDIAFRQGNYAQAITELQAVLQQPAAPKAAAAHALLAECYLKQGDREKARQTLQSLVQRFPTSEFAPRARKLLQQL